MSVDIPAGEKLERSMSKSQDDPTTKWQLLVRETRAISLWTLMSISLRGVLLVLGSMSTYVDSSIVTSVALEHLDETLIPRKTRQNIPCILALWILKLMPSRVPLRQAPGFIFANPW
jgi:hypothetical protein